MDKSWITKPRISNEYKDGVMQFLEFAFRNASNSEKIMCPCIRCVNSHPQTYEVVREHLICDGFLRGYTTWVFHGEDSSTNVANLSSSSHTTNVHGVEHGQGSTYLNPPRLANMADLLRDALREPIQLNNEIPIDMDAVSGQEDSIEEEVQHNRNTMEQIEEPSNGEGNEFYKMLKDVDKELYPGCKTFSKLSFVLHLYHLKCLNGWTGKSFTMLLELLIDAFPEGTSLPKSYYDAKKIIQALGLNYEKIHSCKQDCMLFWGENENLESCNICGTSRWKMNKETEQLNSQGDMEETSVRNKKPVKVLRYFPLIPRLQRIFASPKTARDMKWHDDGRKKDGLLRHPADGEAWKEFDTRYPHFASDPRNVRLALCTDGFNPFRTMSTTYSTWPVLLIPYNTPPWICMKQSSFILSMIIPGDKSPGNDIDIYLQPLVEELKQLWEGVPTYDAYNEQTFLMHAALMWTISDFPAYAILSGWSTKGKFACPCCAELTCSKWLYKSGKYCYMGHRKWLPDGHIFRKQIQFFDGTEELQLAPLRMTGSDVLKQLDGFHFTFGKPSQCKQKKRKKNSNVERARTEQQEELNERSAVNVRGGNNAIKWWKKRSIFFELPYWEHNLLRHNLDVMHIEKNVCDNILGTLLNIDGKSKDNLKARLDLEDLGIRNELHAKLSENGKRRLPPASFTMTRKEKHILCQVLKSVKLPDGYASNISRCVNLKENKISGLKSHDCHILLQYLLPLAIRSCSPSKEVTSIVIEVAAFFKSICAKVIDVTELDKIQNRIVLTLCHMERTFLPSFFTIMIHLIVHLVEEVKIGGPVQYRWMYPPERSFVRYKSMVGNKARPEGSIAEGYIADECLTFCSRYLEGVETRFNRPLRNPEPSSENIRYLFASLGKPIGKSDIIILDDTSLMQAHRYVLRHSDAIEPFRQEFINNERRKRRRNARLDSNAINKLINEKFHDWLQNRVLTVSDSNISEDIISLGRGPNKVARRFSGYIINGIRFHTLRRENQRVTQNSGVVNTSEIGGLNYYGRLTDIVELNYYDSFKVVLFRCDWYDVHHNTGIKQDEFGFTLVNCSCLIHTGEKVDDDPYVFSSQVDQVFYVQDPKNPDWHLVVRVKPRDFYDMGNEIVLDETIDIMPNNNHIIAMDEHPSWVRDDVEEDDIIYI